MHVHVYKTHYTIDDKQTAIPFNDFLDCINKLTLPSAPILLPQQPTTNGGSALSSPTAPPVHPKLNDIFPENSFENGNLVVEVTDHRYTPPTSAKVKLKPCLGWLENEGVALEKVLPSYYQLDLEVPKLDSLVKSESPSDHSPLYTDSIPDIARKFNARANNYYNSQKFKRVHRVSKKSHPAVMDTILDPMMTVTREFVPRFSQYKFVQDWKQKQHLACNELLIGLGDKNKIKINPMGNASRKMLIHNLNRRIIRTLRFESNNTKKVYTILNVYEIPETMTYEGNSF
jgi:hypothetical protein